MLLSNMDPIFSEWISFFIPLFSGIAKVLTLSTTLVLMRIIDNVCSKLVNHISGA